ncbi:serine proteinase inhibitor [Ancylostoma caninum]|uniref:Serine proteinase inhibitor n=1 Tax=Ancylostoma caninum TaxID=29170 RepID=A0A368F8S2_ANCCA|nr:serine proteinase inhibitor [Ancylostoma caninum]
MFLAAETDFGLKMLHHAPANEAVVVSPLSVIFAMSMIQAGAKGTTKSQINDVISKANSTSHGGRADKDSQRFFLKVIDDFVSNVTEGKIKDIVNADSVRDAASLIVNAIYFNAEWEYKFYNEGNTKQMFYSAEGNGRELDFMNDMEEHRLYAEDDDTQVLSLQYKDTSYAFNIFLPKKRFGLGEIVEKLDGEKIQHLLSKLEVVYISLTIPKMKIETDFKLKEALMEMGVTDMFSDSADLSGITSSSALKISKAAHKAIIEVIYHDIYSFQL